MNTSCCVARTSDALDLRHVLSYPITEVPLSLAQLSSRQTRQLSQKPLKAAGNCKNILESSPNLVKVSAYHGEQVHLVHDKYQSQSIKILSASCIIEEFIIIGPDQAQRQSNAELFKNDHSKKHLLTFLWKNGRSLYMDQSLEERLCIFHMVIHA